MDRKWHTNRIALILLLCVVMARAQEKEGANDLSKPETNTQRQVAKNIAGASATAQPEKPQNAAPTGDTTANERVKQPEAAGTATSTDRTSAPLVEDFPTEPPALDVMYPHAALPVILNPNSPDLDRRVRREDIKPAPEDYVIGEEDILTVTVWKERDLSGTMAVRPDGKITVPLVGEINVVGMKPAQLEKLLDEKLKPFVTVPQVAVGVNQINSRKIYLIGQVVHEGTVPINSSMTVLQVLAGAGGLRDFAKRKKIYILRKQGDQEIRFPFDYDAAIRGRNTEQNIRVEPGDTIVVP